MLMATIATNAQTKSAVQEVRDYLHECGTFYIIYGEAKLCSFTEPERDLKF